MSEPKPAEQYNIIAGRRCQAKPLLPAEPGLYLTPDEADVLDKYRQARNTAGKRPYLLTVYGEGETIRFWIGQPGGITRKQRMIDGSE